MRFRATPTLAAWAAGPVGIAGFVAIFISWRGAAGTPSLPLQVPYLLSGGFVGLGLVLFAVMVAHVELSRRLAAEETAALQDVVTAAAGLAIVLRDARAQAAETATEEADAGVAEVAAPPAPRRRRTRRSATG